MLTAILTASALMASLPGTGAGGYKLPTDCAWSGQNKVLATYAPAGNVWEPTNTSRWCNPSHWRHQLTPSDDPVFSSDDG